MKTFKRIISWSIWGIVALYFLVVVLLHVPAVQQSIGSRVSQALSDKLGTRVSVGKVDLGFVNRLIVDDVDIYDQQGVLMLHAARLSAKVAIYPLAQGKVSISSAQVFGLKGTFYQQRANEQPNFQFALDSLASKDTTSHTPLDLRINSLIVRHGSLSYDRRDMPLTNGRFNVNHLGLSGLSAHIMLNHATDSTLDLAVKKLALTEHSGIRVKSLSFKLEANPNHAALHNFELRMPETELNIDSVVATYRMENGKLIMPTLKFNGNISQSHITPKDLSGFEPTLKSLDTPYYITSTFSGTSTTLRVHTLDVHSNDNGMQLKANGSLTNLSSPVWSATVEHLGLSAETIAKLAGGDGQGFANGIPKEITRLGDVSFKGLIGARGRKLTAKGALLTDAGNVAFGIGLKGNDFTGRIETGGIDLRRILDNNDFGLIATAIDINGTLRQNQQPILAAKGTILRLDYKSYQYNNITVDGRYDGNVFDGLLDINDPNGQVSLHGRLGTTEKLPVAQLEARLRNLTLSAMHITDTWGGATINADIDTDFTGNSLNTAEGTLNIRNFSMKRPISDSNNTDNGYTMNNLSLLASNTGGEHLVRMESDFAEITLRGDYDYKTLAQSVTNFIGSKLPTLPGLPKTNASRKNNFTVSATVSDSEWMSNLLGIPVRLDEPLYLYGHMNDREHKMTLECSAPSLVYDGNRYEDVRLSLSTPDDTLHANIDLKRAMDNGRKTLLSVKTSAADNNLVAHIGFDGNQRDAFRGNINLTSQFFNDQHGKPTAHVRIHPSEILVNDTVWHVLPSDIVYSTGHLTVDHFAIEHNKQHLIVSGLATKSNADTLTVDLKGIDVNYITNLVNFHSVEFGGLATGRAYLSSVFGNPSANANLRVDHFTFEDGRMGTLNAQVDYNQRLKQIEIEAVADDGSNQSTIISGYVSPAHNQIDLGITANNTRLEFLESFCGSFMRNIEATGRGELRLWGALNELNLTGTAVANGTLDISSLNTTYTLRNDTIRLIPNEIVFQADTISDRDGNIGIVSGSLYHDHIKNLSYDIKVEARNLLAYDFNNYGDDTFFGTVWATGDCSIRGKSGEVVIDVNATPERGSFIEYNASAPDAIGNQAFIEWRDATPHPTSKDQQTAERQEKSNEIDDYDDIPTDIRLNFIINATPEATLRLLMDKASGDYIALNGSGTIRATYYNKGAFDMFGTYLVDHGIYKLTIQNVIKKDFQFQQGGTIVFGGDPYNAVLQLQALYTVNGVPLSDLRIGRSFSNNNIRVDCIMNITGNPYEPKVDFDLDLPTVSTDAKQMVRSIINGQEEMNQQVIYLLGIGRFYVQESNNAAAEENAQQSQTSLAMQSLLSGTISQQINSLLGSVLNNNNWNFGANISTGDEGFNNAEYEGLLSGRLLNNRLLINGQFGYRDNANATTSFIGDFDIRYLLTPSGNLSAKVYNQTNDRYFTKSSLNTQGLGLLMKKDFDGLGDLFGRNRRKKK